MATANIDALIARRAEIYSTLNTMTISTVGGKPNLLIQDGGQAIDHVKFRMSLYDELEKLDKLILAAQSVQDAIDGNGGGIEIMTQLAP